MSGPDVGLEAPPIIVTLAMEDAARARFQALRDAHFPPELNRVPAHLTLFHALPGTAADEVEDVARRACAREPFLVEVLAPRSLGRGVAFPCASATLAALREEIASAFRDRLTRQDAQGWRPHVTVQNKVTPERARATLERLSREFEPWSFEALGLDLWDYLGGPWKHRARVVLGE